MLKEYEPPKDRGKWPEEAKKHPDEYRYCVHGIGGFWVAKGRKCLWCGK